MRFSIREMLALTFLVALGMLAWRVRESAARDEVRLAELQNEVLMLEARLRLDNPRLHQAFLHTFDEHETLRQVRERAVARFDLLRQKYSTMEPRPSDVFSLRCIPSLQTGRAVAPAVYRMLVPEDRTIWLKCGVHLEQESEDSRRDVPKRLLALPRDEPTDASPRRESSGW